MAVFRIEKTRDYTVMSNHHLRDKSLSLKAKGLLSLMLSLPEEWDYTTKGLARICKDGVDSICAGVRELEEHGYVIRQRVRNANGQLGAIEYTILEQPRPPEPKPGKPERENPVLDNPEQAYPVLGAVSYTHLDVYKRQVVYCLLMVWTRDKSTRRIFMSEASQKRYLACISEQFPTCLLYTSRCV